MRSGSQLPVSVDRPADLVARERVVGAHHVVERQRRGVGEVAGLERRGRPARRRTATAQSSTAAVTATTPSRCSAASGARARVRAADWGTLERTERPGSLSGARRAVRLCHDARGEHPRPPPQLRHDAPARRPAAASCPSGWSRTACWWRAPTGLTLVDTGFGTGDLADPKRLGGPFVQAIGARLDPAETAVAQVRALGYAAGRRARHRAHPPRPRPRRRARRLPAGPGARARRRAGRGPGPRATRRRRAATSPPSGRTARAGSEHARRRRRRWFGFDGGARRSATTCCWCRCAATPAATARSPYGVRPAAGSCTPATPTSSTARRSGRRRCPPGLRVFQTLVQMDKKAAAGQPGAAPRAARRPRRRGDDVLRARRHRVRRAGRRHRVAVRRPAAVGSGGGRGQGRPDATRRPSATSTVPLTTSSRCRTRDGETTRPHGRRRRPGPGRAWSRA